MKEIKPTNKTEKTEMNKKKIKDFLDEITRDGASMDKIKETFEYAQKAISRACEAIHDDKKFDYELESLCVYFAELEVVSNELFETLETIMGLRGEVAND